MFICPEFKFVKNRLSIVIPCHNSEKTIEDVIKKCEHELSINNIIDREYILVNDFSNDRTEDVLRKLFNSNNNIKVINLAKNAGQHGALMAGFHYVTGEFVVTCDDDGQTPFEKVGEMFKTIQSENIDVVSVIFNDKKNNTPLFRKIGSKIAAKMSEKMISRPDGIKMSIFFMVKRYVSEEIIKYTGTYPYITGLVLRTTHNIVNINADRLGRHSGKSGYDIKKLFNLWLNGFTSFSTKPIHITVSVGLLLLICGVSDLLITIFKKIIWNINSNLNIVISIMVILFGLLFCILGIIGEYIGRIYMEINNSPQFVIKNIFIRKNDNFK